MWYFIGITSTIFLAAIFNKRIANGITFLRKDGLNWSKQLATNYVSKKLIETHHRYYIIHYPRGVRWYKMIIPRKRGPCKITQITNNTRDVTCDVLQFMGPSHTFHGIRVTPKMLGYTQLSFHFLDSTVLSFEESDIITV